MFTASLPSIGSNLHVSGKTVAALASAAVLLLLATAMLPAAFAATPQNGFGKAARFLGNEGLMGCHSSSFDEPRDGIGNVARQNDATVSQLGDALLAASAGGVPGC